MDANEAKVRAAWESCAVEDHRMCCGSGSWRWVCEPYQSGWADSESSAWAAAAEFTASRQQAIADVDRDIRWLCVADYSGSDGEMCEEAEAALKSTLTRLQAARAELTRGIVTPQPKESQ